MPISNHQHLARYGHVRVMAPEGGDDTNTAGGGGASSSQPPNTPPDDALKDPKVQALIQSAVESQVAGLKAKNSELIQAQKQLKEQLARFEGIDPDAVRGILKRFADDEEAKLIADGKVDEVLNRRTERMKADFEKKLAEAQQEAEKARQLAQTYQSRVVEKEIMTDAVEAGVHKHALEDALLHAKAVFRADDEGRAIAVDADGNPILGKDGKTPLTPREWLEGMKEKKPHWFLATASGSGTPGGKGGFSSAKKAQEMTSAEKAKFIQEHGFAKWQEKVRADYG